MFRENALPSENARSRSGTTKQRVRRHVTIHGRDWCESISVSSFGVSLELRSLLFRSLDQVDRELVCLARRNDVAHDESRWNVPEYTVERKNREQTYARTHDTARMIRRKIRLVSRRRAHWYTRDWREAAGGAREFAYDTPSPVSRRAISVLAPSFSFSHLLARALSSLLCTPPCVKWRVHQPCRSPIRAFFFDPPRTQSGIKDTLESVFLPVSFLSPYNLYVTVSNYHLIISFRIILFFFAFFLSLSSSFNNYVFYLVLEYFFSLFFRKNLLRISQYFFEILLREDESDVTKRVSSRAHLVTKDPRDRNDDSAQRRAWLTALEELTLIRPLTRVYDCKIS